MTNQLPPSLERFGDELDRAAHRLLSTGPEPAPARAGVLRRPRVLATSSLGLAGVGAAVLLALSGTADTTPAYAITQNGDGTVLLKVNFGGPNTLEVADRTLVDEYHEAVLLSATPVNGANSGPLDVAPGPSTNPAPIACTPTADQAAPGDPTPSGPQVKLLIGKDNTFVIPSGSTGAGTAHLVACQTSVELPDSNTGAGNTGAGTGNAGHAGDRLVARPTTSPAAGGTGTTGNTGN